MAQKFPFFVENLEDLNCTMHMMQAVRVMQNQMEAKAAVANKFGADMYAITIIGAFASIIILLMFRSIRPHQSVDDQVTLMMASMQMRVEVDEMARQKQKMKEAKKKAQEWIKELKERSRRSLSRSSKRSKSTCDTPPVTIEDQFRRLNQLLVPRTPSLIKKTYQKCSIPDDATSSTSTRQSICSAPTQHFLGTDLPARPKSHLGFVPEIVVTPETKYRLLLAPPGKNRRTSMQPQRNFLETRKSSISSYNSFSPSLLEEFVFQFPDTPNDSPPFDLSI
ncbi:unnamed protein product [Caenorhabditis angaria]|uniref:Uncharacterized protein n=1 Tax=Caenorhabditis angaria TaxID=860376 RepID=A0A9P1MUT5_9PELO|nr:unnamed protein product [Caenorhabditis angaria]